MNFDEENFLSLLEHNVGFLNQSTLDVFDLGNPDFGFPIKHEIQKQISCFQAKKNHKAKTVFGFHVLILGSPKFGF